ncbi:MAG: hypothetical protein ACFWT6_03105 [Virgibacillus proomii]|jgi:hypothetical protein
MELKYVIPNMEKTFGNLEYAGEGKVEQRRINGRMTTLSRSYNLYSDIQRADDIEVILPQEAGEKFFEHEEKVKLVNARITAEGYKIGTIVCASDILLGNHNEFKYRFNKLSEKDKSMIKDYPIYNLIKNKIENQ